MILYAELLHISLSLPERLLVTNQHSSPSFVFSFLHPSCRQRFLLITRQPITSHMDPYNHRDWVAEGPDRLPLGKFATGPSCTGNYEGLRKHSRPEYCIQGTNRLWWRPGYNKLLHRQPNPGGFVFNIQKLANSFQEGTGTFIYHILLYIYIYISLSSQMNVNSVFLMIHSLIDLVLCTGLVGPRNKLNPLDLLMHIGQVP